MGWLRSWWCAFRRHDSVLQFEDERMFLECVTCGHRSPGWTLGLPRPAVIRAKVIRFRRRLGAA